MCILCVLTRQLPRIRSFGHGWLLGSLCSLPQWLVMTPHEHLRHHADPDPT